MALIEQLDPQFARTMREAFALNLNVLSHLTRTSFDEVSRLRSRVEYIDDGYVRVRDAADTSISLVELLKEFSWINLNMAETSEALQNSIGPPNAQPTSKGIMLHGFDGTYARRIKTDADGSLLVKTV